MFKPVTEEVPDEDFVDEYAAFDLSKVDYLGEGQAKCQIGDLWSGTSEYCDEKDYGPRRDEQKTGFEAGDPMFSRFLRPLTNYEAAERLTYVMRNRKWPVKELETTLQDKYAENFMEPTLQGQMPLPTELLERWTQNLSDPVDDPARATTPWETFRVPKPPSETKMPAQEFLDRKGRVSEFRQLVDPQAEVHLPAAYGGTRCWSHHTAQKKSHDVTLPHRLQAVEVIQLCNLAPESVREAKNLIPSLARIPYDSLWHYVNTIRANSKRSVAEAQPKNIQAGGAQGSSAMAPNRHGGTFGTDRTKKRQARMVDVRCLDDDTGRAIFGREAKLRKQAGQEEIARRRAEYNAALHVRRQMGISDANLQDFENVTPADVHRQGRSVGGMVTPNMATPGLGDPMQGTPAYSAGLGGETPGAGGALAAGGGTSVGGGMTPAGVVGGVVGGGNQSMTPLGAMGNGTPGYGVLQHARSGAASQTPVGEFGTSGFQSQTPGLNYGDGASMSGTPAGALEQGSFTPAGALLGDDGYVAAPAGVEIVPNEHNLWAGVKDEDLARMVDGKIEKELVKPEDPINDVRLAGDLDPFREQNLKNLEQERKTKEDRMAIIAAKATEEVETKAEQERVDQAFMATELADQALDNAEKRMKLNFEKGRYFGMSTWFKSQNNLDQEWERIMFDEALKLKFKNALETNNRDLLGPNDRKLADAFGGNLEKTIESLENKKEWFADEAFVRRKGLRKAAVDTEQVNRERDHYIDKMVTKGFKTAQEAASAKSQPGKGPKPAAEGGKSDK